MLFWAVLSDEQMSKSWPFPLLNDEQMSNWLGVEHQPDIEILFDVYIHTLSPPCFPATIYAMDLISSWRSQESAIPLGFKL